MENIKERADKFSKEDCGENCIFVCSDWTDESGVCRRLKSRAALYTSIATEQKAIDDAESGKELLYVVNKTTERVRKEVIDKAWEVIQRSPLAELLSESWFRKSMEE